MGLCFSFIKTFLHNATSTSDPKINDEINKNFETPIPKEKLVQIFTSPQVYSQEEELKKKKFQSEKKNSNLENSSIYQKSIQKSLELETENNLEKAKCDEKSNTFSRYDSNSKSLYESPTTQKKKSEISFQIQKEDLVLPIEILEKLNKIIEKKGNLNLENFKFKSSSFIENADRNNITIEIKDQQNQLIEEKNTQSLSIISKQNKGINFGPTEIKIDNFPENQINLAQTTESKITKPNKILVPATETTIKSSEVNILLLNIKDTETEPAFKKEILKENLPKKSLLKYKTIGEVKKKSLVKKNVKFKGIPRFVAKKK